jgi:hypothetical protein
MQKANEEAGKKEIVIPPWIDEELKDAWFRDVRLGKRLCKLLAMMSDGMGDSIPYACLDWANTKAAYRFFSNDRISEEEILSGHFAATAQRAGQVDGPVLVLHDTSEFVFKRREDSTMGLLRRRKRPCGGGNYREVTLRGILMHSSLVVTPEGLPLGLSAIKFWTRSEFKGTDAKKKKINPTRVPIEEKESFKWLENMKAANETLKRPEQCVHIGDRESDIFELFSLAQDLKTKFLFRTCVDRRAEDGQTTVAKVMAKAEVKGIHTIEVRDKRGNVSKATLEIRVEKMVIKAPLGKGDKCPDLTLTVIHAAEKGTPKGREKIEWKLATNLEVETLAEAIEKLTWYAMRWKIETFHKILKSGCKTEESKLRSNEGLTRLISVCCIISWRVFWMNMAQRVEPAGPVETAITPEEKEVLDTLFPNEGGRTLKDYLLRIAKLGGYLARRNDPPPGNIVMWRGLLRLMDIQFGFSLAKRCG